jgi:hypothetical protein
MSTDFGGDIGGDIADAPRGELVFHLDVILDWLEIHIGEIVVGDIPVDRQLEIILTNEEVREVVAAKMAEAQAEGRALPMPTARELAAARERALARMQS